MTNAKKPPEHYFCWVRVLTVPNMAKPTPPPPPSETFVGAVSELTGKHAGNAHMEGGGTPPPAQVSLKQAVGESKPQVIDKPRGVWTAPKVLFGRDMASTEFDYGPAFLDAKQASRWIAETAEGRAWDAESLNRFLMAFAYFPDGVDP
jgi:hypothetical protein